MAQASSVLPTEAAAAEQAPEPEREVVVTSATLVLRCLWADLASRGQPDAGSPQFPPGPQQWPQAPPVAARGCLLCVEAAAAAG
jgi:hypothetical protein